MSNITKIAADLLSQDCAMDDDGAASRTPEQAIDGSLEASAAAGDLEQVELIDEAGADEVADEYRRLAVERRAAGRRLPSWLSL